MKETYYFSHDYNARADIKIKRLISKHGMAGYGIFWAIVEDLYNNANALPTDYESIAFDIRSDKNLVESVITEFDLFVIDGETFGSSSVERRLNERNAKSDKARESARKRWESMRTHSESNAKLVPTQSEGNAIKESKGKESKGNEKKSFPPKLEISDDGRKFAQWFNDKMKPESIKPSQSDLDKWGQEYDKLIRIDKKEKKQITDAVTWAREDEFWTKNFLSPLKLRQKNKDGIMYVDVFLEKLKQIPVIKSSQQNKIDPQFGYDTSKGGNGKVYNSIIGKFLYPADWKGEKV
jgi:uncharacterized protein YdaU (DUF1376 family)